MVLDQFWWHKITKIINPRWIHRCLHISVRYGQVCMHAFILIVSTSPVSHLLSLLTHVRACGVSGTWLLLQKLMQRIACSSLESQWTWYHAVHCYVLQWYYEMVRLSWRPLAVLLESHFLRKLTQRVLRVSSMHIFRMLNTYTLSSSRSRSHSALAEEAATLTEWELSATSCRTIFYR